MKKINVALVGLGFGGAFAGIYKAHPSVGELTLFDTNSDQSKRTCDFIGGARIASSFDALEKPGQKWHLMKYVGIAGNYLSPIFFCNLFCCRKL